MGKQGCFLYNKGINIHNMQKYSSLLLSMLSNISI